ncbi:MAG TPA: bifunctional diaminohydroxyphosphoribosylaminopyrimidine deaminase/5-amino-6-(5-phosphoribosylamino)uracil reductase RibD, partial [Alkalispirochaeta sp.]|nr:bifunctional diaminohydroxyphosphoribosylaminopyrimidine deaminase/5-amino-6-(5-phosphoribosylamino)uracil reductase RibD [Alkalispirochaeta sp.]
MGNECTSAYLQQTLDLAAAGRTGAPPNPLVGAVITRNDRVVATGYHAQYGGLHAEAEALHAAGTDAAGSTLYCNLEPCSYTAPDKHQPPCTRHIIEAGVKTVVIGQLDPNPHVRGRGADQLREAGIEVRVADDGARFWQFNDVFNTVMAFNRPLIHVKTAMSLDGRIATAVGDSKWITDESARREAHQLRAQRDVVAVGIGTVLADDPSLTTRLVTGEDARPVVFDSHLRIPLGSTLVRTRGHELIVMTRATTVAQQPARARELEQRGVSVVGVASG